MRDWSPRIACLVLGAFLVAGSSEAQRKRRLQGVVAPKASVPARHCLSFTEFQAGERLGEIDTIDGVVVIIGSNPDFSGNSAMVFDSANPSGGDSDLGTPNADYGGPGIGAGGSAASPFRNELAQGNVLVSAESIVDSDGDGLVDDPSDAKNAGSRISIDFSYIGPVELLNFFAMDIEGYEQHIEVQVYNSHGTPTSTFFIPPTGDNGVFRIQDSIPDVGRLVVSFNGSGAIDDICFRRFIDCNQNGVQDHLDIQDGTSLDCNNNGIPDDCEPDCDGNGVPDDCESDCDKDGIPDVCEPDCDGDGIPDDCEPDCDLDGIPDDCEPDCDGDGVPDDCESDCNGNGTPDDCDILTGGSNDANGNGVPDECESVACLGSKIWNDIDRDGVQDPSEPGIEGIVVTLKDALGNSVASTTTDSSGNYLFEGLPAGTYELCVDETSLPPDYVASPCDMGADDSKDNDCSPFTVVLMDGVACNLDADFGFNSPCAGLIGDFVWHDLDRDGIQDMGEPGIEGVLVQLKDDQGAVIASATTGPFGFYSFMGLCAGIYEVCVDPATLPPGLVPSPCNAGADDAVDNDCSPYAVHLMTDYEQDVTIDFGYNQPKAGRIGDFVWNDLDCDGIQDPGEPGIEGVVVELKDAAGTLLEVVTTDHEGGYLFVELCAGDYLVCVDPASVPPGYEPSLCNVGDDATDNDCGPVAVNLPSDVSEDLTIDFGYKLGTSGGQGCTPGYWKQSQHFDSWPAPYTPTMMFSAVFEDAFPGQTLLEVLSEGGGGLTALGRHTVAALLNASKPEVGYDLTVSEVISLFDDLFPATTPEYNALKDYFADFNEQGCPLD